MRFPAAALVLVAGSVAAAGARAQECRGVRPGRAAAIGGVVAGAWAVGAAVQPDWLWEGAPRNFRLNWAASASPSAGQDYLTHVGVTYELSQAAGLAWRGACTSPMTAAWLGAATAFAAVLPKEILDGFHDLGFQVAINLANVAGAALPVVHARWPATRAVALKGFYWPSAEYRSRAPGGDPRSPLSDCAGQRAFVSINPARGGIGPDWWPRWLGVAVGHSTTPWVTEYPGTHVWYATLDLEWRGLPVRGRWWRRAAAVLDQVHVPAPGMRLQRGRLAVGVF